MKTLIVLLATMTIATAAQSPSIQAKREARQTAIDARIYAEAVKQSKSKPDPAAYLAGIKSKQDAIAAKRAARNKAVADRKKVKVK